MDELFGLFLVTPALDENIKHVAILVDGSPQIVRFPIDFEKDLIKMPFVSSLATTVLPFIGVR